MNLNQSLVNKKKLRNTGFGITNFKVTQVMGPPVGLPPKRKTQSTSSSATNWGRSHQSVHNNSTMRSGNTTVSTSESESRVIVALTEGRGDARCEVGMAAIDLSHPTLTLCQISDSQSYMNTLTKINILNPTDILVPSTFLESTDNRLIDRIKKHFPKVKVLSVPRKTFNKTNGMDRILQLCLPSINTICVGLQHKYYTLSAASALITYLQNNLCVYYTKESINVTYQESEGYAIIDVSTADRLELVSSTKPMQATRFSTLFGVLNYCFTKVGARLLRSTILQPPSSPAIIEQTSQCVTELIKHPQMLLSLQAILQKLSSIDQLLTITTMASGSTDSCSVRNLNYLLLLNSLIDLIEPLKNIVENCQQPFFKELKETLNSDKFSLIANQLRAMIHPSAQFAKSDAGITQRCYAIKSGINGLLDLVRKTYSERLNDMKEYVKYLGNKYNLPLILHNNNTKGYHIVLKLSKQKRRSFKTSDLPPEFIQVYRLAGSCTMKTVELINYSTRLEDIMLEILKISNVMIHKTIIDLKQHIGFFYKLCEDIARLDMIQSLAEASRRGNYIKPKFGDFTELTQARHPMLEFLIGEQRVANPISICKNYNIQIITGPNGSGKSIYIRQVMLLQVMAQIGCYVPAESAVFKPMNRMFARIYLEDDMEYGASAFILEMKEVKYMMTLLTENSLFIIDELCRSTSADEGAALAMAICEKFCNTPVFLYLTTHYISLANLADMYLNVKTWQMETISTGDNPQDLHLDFKYRLVPGVTQLKHYGVYIVKNIWPDSILNDVYQILRNLKNTVMNRKFVGVDKKIKLKYELECNIRKLKNRKKLSAAAVNNLLSDYQRELQKLNIFLDFNASDNFVLSDEPINYNHLPYDPDREDDLLITPADASDHFETSSYRNLSNFLKEDSDNINKLIPEITIACSRGNSFDGQSLETVNLSENSQSLNNVRLSTQPSCEVIESPESYSQFENCDGNFTETRHSIKLDTARQETLKNTNIIYDGNNNNTNKLQSNSSAIIWGDKLLMNEVEEVQSIIDDIESCKDSFFSEEEFDFSQESSYKSAVCTCPEKEQHQHIIPIVKIIEGPAWESSDSSSCNTTQQEEEIEEMLTQCSASISYSPLQSPSSNNNCDKTTHSNKADDSVNALNTSASSLHLLRKNREQANYINAEIINIRLENTTNGDIMENINSSSNRSDKNSRNSQTNGSNVEKDKVDNNSKTESGDTNLENISINRRLDNITVENLKSNSITIIEKPSISKSESNDDSGSKAVTITSSAKESDKSDSTSSKQKIKVKKSNKKGKAITTGEIKSNILKPSKKFIPPKKLTRKEIIEEFNEQDRKIYETDISDSNFSKYLSQILKRPSVKQVQQSKHLAFVRRTESGVEVIPAKPDPVKKPRKFPFKRTISNSNNVDVSIFSDKNAKSFDEFLNSTERDVKRFKFNLNSQQDSHPDKTQQFNFNPQSISDYALTGPMQFSFKPENVVPLNQNTSSDNFQTLSSFAPITPDGFYKQNKEDINHIMNKYLPQDEGISQLNRKNVSDGSSVFETCSFNDDYLNL